MSCSSEVKLRKGSGATVGARELGRSFFYMTSGTSNLHQTLCTNTSRSFQSLVAIAVAVTTHNHELHRIDNLSPVKSPPAASRHRQRRCNSLFRLPISIHIFNTHSSWGRKDMGWITQEILAPGLHYQTSEVHSVWEYVTPERDAISWRTALLTRILRTGNRRSSMARCKRFQKFTVWRTTDRRYGALDV